MAGGFEDNEFSTGYIISEKAGVLPGDQGVFFAGDYERGNFDFAQAVVNVVMKDGLEPVVERNGIDWALTPCFDHRRNNFRMVIDVAFGEGRFGERPAPLLGGHRRRRIGSGEGTPTNPHRFRTTRRGASEHD